VGGSLVKKKIPPCIITVLLISVFILTIDMTFEPLKNVRAVTWYVGSGLGNDSVTIQGGIDLSFDGDTVFVYNGTYNENVVVNKIINLIGEDKDNTTIDGGEIGDVVKITVNWVNLTRFTVTGGGPSFFDSGIELSNNNNCRINDTNVIFNQGNGIFFFYSLNNTIIDNCITSNNFGVVSSFSSSNNVITNNIILNNVRGIRIDSSSNITIINNNITSNDVLGISLDHSSNITIMNNSIANNRRGIFFGDSNSNSMITNNSILGNTHFGIYSGENVTGQFNYWGTTDLTKIERMVNNVDYSNPLSADPTGMDLQFIVDAVWSGTIYIDSGTIINGNVTVTGATIVFNHSKEQNFIQVNGKMIVENSTLNSNSGLYTVLYTNNSIGYIKDSTIMGQRAISLETDGLTVSGNEFLQGYIGVVCVNGASKNYIANNKFRNNSYSVEFFLSSNNTATDNTITNDVYGISILSSFYNTITKNNISSDGTGTTVLRGIGCDFSSSYNIMANNIIYSTECGISIGHWASNNTIVNNTIYSNNETGIEFTSSSYNRIMNNNLSSNNIYGIYSYNSDGNDIIHNYVSSNGVYGIYLVKSDENNITHNNVSSNLWYGTFLIDSLNNSLYHNNFIDNPFQAFDNTNNSNQWDNGYPSGGNYWSNFDEQSEGAYDDYEGISQDVLGNDDIVDNGTIAGGGRNPYVIDPNSQDNYPLMYPIDDLIFLYKGWNLISIPFIQLDTQLGNVLSSITGSYLAVQWYDVTDTSDPWKHSHTSKPEHLNDLKNLDNTKGFWIYITVPGGVLFEYQGDKPPINQSISLHPGWNLVGYPSLTNKPRDTALNNIIFGIDVDAIQTYDAATKTWEEIGPSDNFELGRGYWVHSLVEKTWEVPL
jgi:parallel beta-helix repeat protein